VAPLITPVITISVISGSSWTWWPSIAKLSVRTVSAEMTPFSALIASHARIKATTTPASSTRLGNGHPYATATDLLTIHLSLGLLRIFSVSKNHEGKAGHRSGHPDLFEGSILAKKLLQIPLIGLTVQVSHVKPVPIVVVPPILERVPASSWTVGSGPGARGRPSSPWRT